MKLRATGEFDRLLETPRVHFIYLHHVFDDEAQNFRRTLSEVARTHQFVTYSKAVELVYSGKVDRPTVCLSFDDGLKTTLGASRVMDELGISGCFFVCPAIVGETDRAMVKRFAETRLHYPPMDVLSWPDIEDMLARGHEIGSHTYSHPNMGDVSVEQAIDELQLSAEELRKRLGGVKHFAWPTGKWEMFSARAGKAAFDLGYQSCASAIRGCHMPRPRSVGAREVCLRRDHIMGSWPLRQNMYFLARSVLNAAGNDYEWPEAWKSIIQKERHPSEADSGVIASKTGIFAAPGC
ncbi:MAG: polysaccharide deacetylase family protein [Phycisphaeraceae bacterium]|nr:polysaccharide deacetylase family protein [Phycisphaeraceae bacterium]